MLVALCALALPTSPAFGEGSVDLNTGPDGADRQGLSMGPAVSYTVLHVYAQAGETIQLGSSAMTATGAGNILVYAPGTDLEGKAFPSDPVFATADWNCDTDDAGTGLIATRAQEQAGPEPSAGDADPATWTPCEYVAPADGIYPVIMMSPDPTGINSDVGSVATPEQLVTSPNIAIWDITVRDAADAVQEGRTFSYRYTLRTGIPNSSGAEVFVYTRTGYEYQVNFANQGGLNWQLTSDDLGVVDRATGDRLFASFDNHLNGTSGGGDNRGAQGATLFPERRYPLFLNDPDLLVVSGPGGLGATRGYASAPITPASNPLNNAAFTGAGGQAGSTNRGSGGTIAFNSPTQLQGLGYTLAIDTNRDGTFGNGTDVVDATHELSAAGNNAFAWNGQDAQGNAPACGDYQYQIRSTLSEVHFTMLDVEESGGTRIERLTLPGDPTLGDPLAASYNDIDPYKGFNVANAQPPAVTDGNSDVQGFHAWDNISGDGALMDTWTRLPEVQTTGTLRLLCADPQVVKSATPNPAVPGEELTFRLAVTNNGPDAATDVVVTDNLPDNVTFQSASAGCAEAGGTVTCTVGSLAAAATRTFEILVDVPSDVSTCIENIATVTNTTFDTNLANNESEICVPVRGRSDLSIAKDPSRTEVGPGGQVMFTLVVRNDGPSDNRGVEVRDPLVAGLTLVSAQPSQGTCSTANNTVDCDLGRLIDGGSAQVLVTAQMTATTCVTNTAQVRGANVDPDQSDNQDSAQVCPVPVEPPPFDLVVRKRANDRSLLVGQRVTYRIVVRNNGPGAAPDVTLKDTINAPVKVVRVRTSAGSCTRRIPMTCELGTIAAGDRVTIRIVAKHRKATGCSPRQRQAASATGAGTDTNPANNMDTVDVCVRKVPRLAITKVANREVVQAGDMFSYRIRVRNRSVGEARRVTVCDRLPSGLRYVSSKPRAERNGRQHCWTIKRLGARKSKTFRVKVRAARGANGRKVNTATVRSPDVRRRARARDRVVVRGVATPVTG